VLATTASLNFGFAEVSQRRNSVFAPRLSYR
jgi:hypothetical protein